MRGTDLQKRSVGKRDSFCSEAYFRCLCTRRRRPKCKFDSRRQNRSGPLTSADAAGLQREVKSATWSLRCLASFHFFSLKTPTRTLLIALEELLEDRRQLERGVNGVCVCKRERASQRCAGKRGGKLLTTKYSEREITVTKRGRGEITQWLSEGKVMCS